MIKSEGNTRRCCIYASKSCQCLRSGGETHSILTALAASSRRDNIAPLTGSTALDINPNRVLLSPDKSSLASRSEIELPTNYVVSLQCLG